MPTEKLAGILFSSYVSLVLDRGREFVQTPELEECIWRVAEIFTAPSHRFGIVLSGTCGNGKTTMMHAIRRTLYYLFKTQKYVLPHKLDIMAGIDIYSAKEVVEGSIKGNQYMHQDILMIDDLGHEPTETMHYGSIRTPIIDLLERRYARQKVTIISTNLTMAEIGQKYRYRIADRLEEMMHDIEFTGSTFRI